MRGIYLFALLSVFFAASVRADDCLQYKLRPAIYVNNPEWTKTVVQPRQHMDLLHGNVIATMVDNYDITADITPSGDGWCVVLKSVNATIGYNNFLVQIDIRHVPESCTYNAVLNHEQEHINAYLSILDDFNGELHNSVYSAADSIMPVFVSDKSGIDSVVDGMNVQLQMHPDVILVKQKIKTAEEIRNRRIDLQEHGDAMRRCVD